MKQEDLQNNMRYHLNNLKKEPIEITDDTIHSDVLKTDDGFGAANTQNIYEYVVKDTFVLNDEEPKAWPENWPSLSVKELAAKLVIFLLILLSSFSAQSQLTVSLGAGKTELKNAAITIGLSYTRSLDSIWGRKTFFKGGKKSLFAISPEANITTGNQDAFSSINIKAVGMWMVFQTTTVSNLKTPNTAKTFHCFPFSLGAETNNLFNTINGIAEIGWVPWYQAYTSTLPDWMKRTKMGIFLQGGYKFYVDSTGKTAIGGQIDQSLELPQREILRTKGSFGIDTKNLTNINGLGIGLVGNADVWYDILHGVWYHHLGAAAKFYISNDSYIMIMYDHGSGAPNFNLGDQFATGLTVKF